MTDNVTDNGTDICCNVGRNEMCQFMKKDGYRQDGSVT